ncbi:hypothetical protein NUW58_g9445 [Xylaria curta]|uniref:Uncharacterized protein n=1 Tax=Xylaria curta TaxID=42375 RepID=A0ACC1MWD3_9PEZI|nr:hypothetical protein NUW58_g9445 [Xylaria curta]
MYRSVCLDLEPEPFVETSGSRDPSLSLIDSTPTPGPVLRDSSEEPLRHKYLRGSLVIVAEVSAEVSIAKVAVGIVVTASVAVASAGIAVVVIVVAVTTPAAVGVASVAVSIAIAIAVVVAVGIAISVAVTASFP